MTSFRLGLHVAAASFVALLGLSGCDGEEEDDTAGDTMSVTTGAMTTTTGATEDGDDTTADSSGGGSELSHDVNIQPIWDAHCVDACHTDAPGAEWSFLNMDEGEAYDSLVDKNSTQAPTMPFIDSAGDPQNSYLWHKIMGTQADAGGGGLDMPKARPMMEPTELSQEELDTLEAWIMAGAPM